MKKMLVASAVGSLMMVFASGAMAASAKDIAHGKEVFGRVCFACHATGAAGAPKVGDKAEWGPRIAKGLPTLLNHAENGFTGKSGSMPPRGTCGDCSNDDLKAAIEYMISQAK